MADDTSLPDLSNLAGLANLPPGDDPFADLPPWAQMGRGAPDKGPLLPPADPDKRRAWIVIAPQALGMKLVGLADRAAHQAEMQLRDLQVQIISRDSKLAPPDLLDLHLDSLDDADDAHPGLPPAVVGQRIAAILAHLQPQADDVKITITDAELERPPGAAFSLWYVLEPWGLVNSVLFSTHFLDPLTWGESLSEELRLATIERRLTAALINVLAMMLGHEPCQDPECYLYRPIERVRRLDYMTGFVGVHAHLLNTRLNPGQEAALRQQLVNHQTVLQTLETQRIQMGALTPAYVLLGIEESRREIERIKRQLDEAHP